MGGERKIREGRGRERRGEYDKGGEKGIREGKGG